MDVAQFLDEFRPFRRGELALARKQLRNPDFLPSRELHLLRYGLRLAQLSSIGGTSENLMGPLESFRLRLLQTLAPVLPTETREIDSSAIVDQLPSVTELVFHARRAIIEAGLISAESLDAEIARKQLVLVMGGAGGCGYVYLGALQRLAELALEPSYLVGCSLGAILGVFRARSPEFSLGEVFDEIQLLSARSVFQRPNDEVRFGFPSALRLDLLRAVGHLFSHPDGQPLRLGELSIPIDIVVSGVGRGALETASRAAPDLSGVDLHQHEPLGGLSRSTVGRVRDAFVSLAMSRRLLRTLVLGADSETASIPALHAAGFSSAIPFLLHYDVPEEDREVHGILDKIFKRHDLEALIDGVMTTTTPAREAWHAVESGRIGSRNCVIVALHAMQAGSGPSRMVLRPFQHVVATTIQRDKPFWDIAVSFKKGPSLLELFPRDRTLRRAVKTGRSEFEDSAQLLGALLSPLPPWHEITQSSEP